MQMKKILLSGMIGNALEWYDYALYGHCAVIISRLFFPSSNDFIGLMAAFGVFAAGFLMRPLGAILFGYIGDQYGRKLALSLSILLMAIPTACLGLLPTYEQIGILAPLLLTIIRLLQGLSLGGEASGSIIFMVEHTSPKRRGLVGSTVMCSASIGILLGSATAAGVAKLMTEIEFESWGWRIPFLISFFIGGIGWYIRTHLDESPLYEALKADGALSKMPLKELLLFHKKPLLLGIGIYITLAVSFYVLTVFLNSFMTTTLHYPVAEALSLNTLTIGLLALFIPIIGALSDVIGKRKILLMTVFGFLLFSLPIFWLITSGSYLYLICGIVFFSLLVASYTAPFPAVFVELFPVRIRYTGLALSYNFSVTVFGGTAPLVVTWLLNKTGNPYSIAAYMMSLVTLSALALLLYKEPAENSL